MSYELVLSLDGYSHDFVMGFEMGRLWEQFRNDEPFEQTIHAQNIEIVMRMAEATGRVMYVEDLEGAHGEWISIEVDKRSEEAAA